VEWRDLLRECKEESDVSRCFTVVSGQLEFDATVTPFSLLAECRTAGPEVCCSSGVEGTVCPMQLVGVLSLTRCFKTYFDQKENVGVKSFAQISHSRRVPLPSTPSKQLRLGPFRIYRPTRHLLCPHQAAIPFHIVPSII
jgi:hypothetical protein